MAVYLEKNSTQDKEAISFTVLWCFMWQVIWGMNCSCCWTTGKEREKYLADSGSGYFFVKELVTERGCQTCTQEFCLIFEKSACPSHV